MNLCQCKHLVMQAALKLNLRGVDELGWACEALVNLSLQIRPTGLGMRLGRPTLWLICYGVCCVT